MGILAWCLLGGAFLLNFIIALTAHFGTVHYIEKIENDPEADSDNIVEAKNDVFKVKFMIWFFVLLILAFYVIIALIG